MPGKSNPACTMNPISNENNLIEMKKRVYYHIWKLKWSWISLYLNYGNVIMHVGMTNEGYHGWICALVWFILFYFLFYFWYCQQLVRFHGVYPSSITRSLANCRKMIPINWNRCTIGLLQFWQAKCTVLQILLKSIRSRHLQSESGFATSSRNSGRRSSLYASEYPLNPPKRTHLDEPTRSVDQLSEQNHNVAASSGSRGHSQERESKMNRKYESWGVNFSATILCISQYLKGDRSQPFFSFIALVYDPN